MLRVVMPLVLPFGLAVAAVSVHAQTLPNVPVPAENPITEEKRVLGKILFWDEQLSTDNLTACGTCHIPSAAGGDPRIDVNPGLDGAFNTPDDVFGSPGVPRADANGNYIIDPAFDARLQVTGRQANIVVNAAYASDLFWDGRATSEFVDPETGEVVIAGGGGLESQAVGPPLSSVEMAHEGMDWPAITSKLASAVPLALAADFPADVDAVLASQPTYPELFEAAFGDPAISARRIAFALATYQRTLVSDQSPWDRWILGDPAALTPQQIQGWNAFIGSTCAVCHIPPEFTDHTFRSLGVRPDAMDAGRGAITGDPLDIGKFKTPTLRNVGLKTGFMHTGEFFNMQQVLTFYAAPPRPGVANLDPLMPSPLPPNVRAAVDDFLTNGLTDPRVANETFPFDRPTLRSEMAANPALAGGGVAGTAGQVPQMLVHNPPLAGSADFRLGVTRIGEGASVELNISQTPPINGVVAADETIFATAASGDGIAPAATAYYEIPNDASLEGEIIFFQWVVPSTGARSRVARATVLCPTGGCDANCPADVNGDGLTTPSDFSAWVQAFNARSAACDQNGDGLCTPQDFSSWIQNFNAGC